MGVLYACRMGPGCVSASLATMARHVTYSVVDVAPSVCRKEDVSVATKVGEVTCVKLKVVQVTPMTVLIMGYVG